MKIKSLMKKSLVIFLAVSAFAGVAHAEDECIPPSFAICTISRTCVDSDSYYELKTTFQSVDSIYVDNADTECGLNDDTAAAALTKLESQAQELKDAGLCKVIMNNIE